jgi:FMN phosphatase YigB (HAD superfamily)
MSEPPRIDRLVFWMAGVLTPHLCQVTLVQTLNAGSPAPADMVFALADLERELATGALSPSEYCEQALHLTRADMPAAELERRIVDALSLHADILRVIDALVERYDVRLLANLPPGWLEGLMDRLSLSTRFDAGHVAVVADFHPRDLSADLLPRLVDVGIIVPGRTLLVDDDPLRAETAIRAGLDAALFVDARRLYRDLGLWGLVPLRQSLPD